MQRYACVLSLLLWVLLPAKAESVLGEYVEARTCSVYAGGCHYSGEYVTAGREALVFWYIREGKWNGVDLRGLAVLAAVVADQNLAEPSARRQSVLYVDSRATPAQRAALTHLLTMRHTNLLGSVREVRSAAISYVKRDREIHIQAPGVADLHVSRYPCQHCVQPHQVWYQPLVTIQQAEVASAKRAVYRDRVLGTVWQRGEENSVFIGHFEWR